MSPRLSRRRLLGTVTSLGMVCAVSQRRAARAAEEYTLRLSEPVAANSAQGLAGFHFAERVARRSNGRIKIEVYPNGQLAAQSDTMDALISGTLDFAIISSNFVTPIVPKFQVFDLPFMFRDFAAGYRVLNGPIGTEFFADLEAKGIVGLCWASGGMRTMETTAKTVISPEDLRGLRMRIQPGPIFAAMYQALGAIPVTIDVSESFTAVQQHVIDGLELVLDAFATSKFYTVVKHVAMTNHVFVVVPLFGSKRKIEALPADLQKIIREEGAATEPFYRDIVVKQTNAAIQVCKQNGVSFSEIQHAAFRKAVEPVYASVQSRLAGDIIERVSRAAGSA